MKRLFDKLMGGNTKKTECDEFESISQQKICVEIVETLLKLMNVSAQIQISEEEEFFMMEIEGKDAGLLIGKQGQTLTALQYITNVITIKKFPDCKKVFIDVEGYKARRKESLIALAKQMSTIAINENRDVELEPMNSFERYIIHKTFENYPHVKTESIGEGEQRRIIIHPD